MPEVRTTPAALDLEVYAGDKNRVELEVLAGGDPVDLTGALVEAEARKAATDADAGVTATIVDIDRQVGQVAVEWDGETLRGLIGSSDRWVGVWDLQITLPGETLPTTPVGGRFTARMDVTR